MIILYFWMELAKNALIQLQIILLKQKNVSSVPETLIGMRLPNHAKLALHNRYAHHTNPFITLMYSVVKHAPGTQHILKMKTNASQTVHWDMNTITPSKIAFISVKLINFLMPQQKNVRKSANNPYCMIKSSKGVLFQQHSTIATQTKTGIMLHKDVIMPVYPMNTISFQTILANFSNVKIQTWFWMKL